MTSNRGSDVFQMFVLKESGAMQRVTSRAMETADVALSPDGSQAAFVAYEKGLPDLYLVNIDSGQVRRLTEDGAKVSTPSWSPDGRKIAFQSLLDKTPKIYVLAVDGGIPRRLTSDAFEEATPSFSPDGRHVAYVRVVGRKESQIRVAELGASSRAIGPEPAKTLDTRPVWSPDGKSIAWSSHDDKRRVGRIMVAKIDGTAARPVSADSGRANHPVWSPNGREIGFLAVREPSIRQSLFVVGADGGNEREVSGGQGEHLTVRWSADGQQLVFIRFERGGGRVFSIRPDRSSERELLGDPGYHSSIEIIPTRDAARTALAMPMAPNSAR